MVWYKDLSPIDYTSSEASTYVRPVGWLAKDHPYPIGDSPKEAYERLCDLFKNPFELRHYLGWHSCDLCQFKGERGVHNLFVPGNGVLYYSPELITHYINAHKYLPPPEFIEAVMRCPDTQTMAYKKAFLENGGRVLVKSDSI